MVTVLSFVSSVLALATVALFVAGVVFLFQPRRMSRRNAGLMIAAGFATAMTFGAVDFRLRQVRADAGRQDADALRQEEEQEANPPRILEGRMPAAPSRAQAPNVKAAISSEAREWATKVNAALDQTTLEQFMPQMPDTIRPEAERRGENRKFTWAFSDGSRLNATFRPRGGAAGDGLVLYMVEVE